MKIVEVEEVTVSMRIMSNALMYLNMIGASQKLVDDIESACKKSNKLIITISDIEKMLA